MNNKKLVEKMNVVLASSYTLYLKTQNYHWNVTGPNFKELHLLFEEQYNDLFTADDAIAERIRMIGAVAPATFKEYLDLTKISEGDSSKNAKEMIKDLADSQAIMIKTLYAALKEAQAIEDEATLGLLVDRISIHEKNEWFLRSSL